MNSIKIIQKLIKVLFLFLLALAVVNSSRFLKENLKRDSSDNQQNHNQRSSIWLIPFFQWSLSSSLGSVIHMTILDISLYRYFMFSHRTFWADTFKTTKGQLLHTFKCIVVMGLMIYAIANIKSDTSVRHYKIYYKIRYNFKWSKILKV